MKFNIPDEVVVGALVGYIVSQLAPDTRKRILKDSSELLEHFLQNYPPLKNARLSKEELDEMANKK